VNPGASETPWLIAYWIAKINPGTFANKMKIRNELKTKIILD
jgi:hypothetical protein